MDHAVNVTMNIAQVAHRWENVEWTSNNQQALRSSHDRAIDIFRSRMCRFSANARISFRESLTRTYEMRQQMKYQRADKVSAVVRNFSMCHAIKPPTESRDLSCSFVQCGPAGNQLVRACSNRIDRLVDSVSIVLDRFPLCTNEIRKRTDIKSETRGARWN